MVVSLSAAVEEGKAGSSGVRKEANAAHGGTSFLDKGNGGEVAESSIAFDDSAQEDLLDQATSFDTVIGEAGRSNAEGAKAKNKGSKQRGKGKFVACNNATDHLHISSLALSPRRPRAGAPVALEFEGKPDSVLRGGTAYVSLFTTMKGAYSKRHKLPVCTNITCPIAVNATFKAKYVVPMPSEEDMGTSPDICVQLTIIGVTGRQLTCKKGMNIKIVPTNITRTPQIKTLAATQRKKKKETPPHKYTLDGLYRAPATPEMKDITQL
jgi:hypothetical protein